MKNIDVVILCGGQGKRLRKVISDRPKAMVEINGRPFLNILIGYLAAYGAKRFILCTGYKSDYIESYYKNHKSLEFIIAKEKKPLGTAGAIKNAQKLIKSNPFMAMNGDSFCPVDLDKFLSFHKNKKALVSMVVVKHNQNFAFGSLVLNNKHRVIEFREKDNVKNGFVNAGIYLFDKKAFSGIPYDSKISLEYNLFPDLIDNGLYGFIADKKLIDIGTPKRYEYAKDNLTTK